CSISRRASPVFRTSLHRLLVVRIRHRMSNMTPVLAVAATWALFIATHTGLATLPVRSALIARLGERGFLVVYSLVAAMAFAALAATYAAVRDLGPSGPGLATLPLARGALVFVIVVGFMLMTAALSPSGYWNAPIAVLAHGVRAPFGLERISRHPFFT